MTPSDVVRADRDAPVALVARGRALPVSVGLEIAVVIPSFKVEGRILDLLARITAEVSRIYVVDDCCPHGSGRIVEEGCRDPRVTLLRHASNQGVGGAVMTGYRAALAAGADIIVKIDGDGQMDPALLLDFIAPIQRGEADYTKGNRFYNLERIHAMPRARLFGNAALSFATKLSSGYWNLFDPTNGYTAIHRYAAEQLPLHKISRRYFFESDMLFRLNLARAVVVDVPMDAKYEGEVSNLRVSAVIGEFAVKHFKNSCKRVFYSYYLRDMSLASLELPLGLLMLGFGTLYGIHHWLRSISTGISASAGTVMLSGLPIILGLQFILAFIGHDIQSVPSKVLHRLRRSSHGSDDGS